MMLPTHALGGMALALPLLVVAPEFAPLALGAGLVGGIFPDLDMYAGHRKTLHFPVYYSVLAVLAIGVAVLVPTGVTVAVAVFLLAAALHCATDVLGSGLELRPWEGTSDRAVYDHYRRTWIPPRRLVRYDGSPADLMLSVTLALPLLYTLEGVFQWLVFSTVAVAAVYTALRRRLADLAAVVARRIPTGVQPYVPNRYLEDLESETRTTRR
ncbi:metal-dependent hydrolase [Natronococcus sp. A-GB7]|uniref:metal-dependent hydrolase n=1 Tax=Natronococcus sp. A-GB7 TaxID=3037649 RepID=UPI00241F8259|nr:metal-dependent hydrolase [Natronococcus sp. A-GB7]MDG5820675.1 metal-dependent hydrolase [Natronococcus sp. A-GB7]